MFKRLLRSQIAAHAASMLINLYLRLAHATSRWELVGFEHFRTAEDFGTGVILAFWHGRLMMAPTVRHLTKKRVFMLISNHRDGQIIANAVKSYGIEFIRGSAANPKKLDKDKKGASAIVQMLAALGDGHIVGVTPDGPRGPREKAQIGVIRTAIMAGAPILPAAFSVRRGWELNTWDRFLLAAPFTQGVYVAGPPIAPPAKNDPEAMESLRLSIEKALVDVKNKADAMTGRIQPAPGADEQKPTK